MLLTSSQRSAQAKTCGATGCCTTNSSTVCWTVQFCPSICCTTTGCATGCATGCTTVCCPVQGQVTCGLCPNAISPRPANVEIAILAMAFLICLFITLLNVLWFKSITKDHGALTCRAELFAQPRQRDPYCSVTTN